MTSNPSDAELLAFGYAPGSYVSKCLDCDTEVWHVDKRCLVCRPCAVTRFQKAGAAPIAKKHLPDSLHDLMWDLGPSRYIVMRELILQAQELQDLLGVAFTAIRTKFNPPSNWASRTAVALGLRGADDPPYRMSPDETSGIPTMDVALRFMRSNPQTSWEMLIEILGIGSEDTAAVSGGRFRELWELAGGAYDKKGRAWIEIQILPAVLRKIVDAIQRLPPEDAPSVKASEPRLEPIHVITGDPTSPVVGHREVK